MNESSSITAAQFVSQRHTFPDGGRWLELVQGQLEQLEPPDVLHGNVVMNLSKTLAEHFQQAADDVAGYACFELGLKVASHPDTVRFPAISLYFGSERFSETDKIVTEKMPQLAIEIASTPKRRSGISQRVEEYHAVGIATVWVIDSVEKAVHLIDRKRSQQTFQKSQTLIGTGAMSSFQMSIGPMFEDPSWWNGP